MATPSLGPVLVIVTVLHMALTYPQVDVNNIAENRKYNIVNKVGRTALYVVWYKVSVDRRSEMYRSGGWVWILGSCLFVSAGCGSSVGYYFISAHELYGISVCNCDKIGSSNNLDLDAQANRGKCHLSCDRRYPRLHFVFPMLFSTMWVCEITCKYQACIASINMRASPSRNYIEKTSTYFLITPLLSYLRSTFSYYRSYQPFGWREYLLSHFLF